MISGLIGKKIGMKQLFTENGEAKASTVIQAGPCPLLQKKTRERDGYAAVQLAFGKKKSANRPRSGHFKKWNVEPAEIVREFRVDEVGEDKDDREVTVGIFSGGDFVDVTAVPRGKGFMGVVKRWGFSGGKMSHGSHKWNRRPGSIGASADPARVLKGQKMAGRAGKRKVTVQNLRVLEVDEKKNLIIVEGAVPGAREGYLIVRKAKKKTRPVEPESKKQ